MTSPPGVGPCTTTSSPVADQALRTTCAPTRRPNAHRMRGLGIWKKPRPHSHKCGPPNGVHRNWSGCRDLNPGPLDPQSSAAPTKLRHSPHVVFPLQTGKRRTLTLAEASGSPGSDPRCSSCDRGGLPTGVNRYGCPAGHTEERLPSPCRGGTRLPRASRERTECSVRGPRGKGGTIRRRRTAQGRIGGVVPEVNKELDLDGFTLAYAEHGNDPPRPTNFSLLPAPPWSDPRGIATEASIAESRRPVSRPDDVGMVEWANEPRYCKRPTPRPTYPAYSRVLPSNDPQGRGQPGGAAG